MTSLTVENRALAAFLGFAIGDALGATVEFMTSREIAAQYGVHREIVGGGWLRLKAGRVTDDTEMSLALGRSLLRHGGLDLHDVCEEFAAWLKSGPIDVGNTCRRGIRRYIVHGTVEGTFAPGDAGNGAAMRVLPVALATFGDPGKAEPWTLGQGRATHHHPLSDSACLALVEMVHILLHGGSKEETRKIADALVEKHKGFRFVPYPGRCTPYVVDTHANRVPLLLQHRLLRRLRHPDRQPGRRCRYYRGNRWHAGRRHLRNGRHPRELACKARRKGGRHDPPAGASAARDLRGGRPRSGKTMN